jgi:hypothetical protein
MLSDGDRISLMLAPYESRVFLFNGRAGTSVGNIAKESSKPSAEQLVDLSTDWKVQFADDSAPQTLSKPTSWTDLPGKQNYSGEAAYSRTFSIGQAPKSGEHIFIDFGTGTAITDNRRPNAAGMRALLDPPIREAAVVVINGQRAGSLWHPPYRIDITSLVKSGENRIEVKVYNTAINLLAGQPARDYTALRAKYGHRFDPQDMDHLKPIPSGLLGPIRVEMERDQ